LLFRILREGFKGCPIIPFESLLLFRIFREGFKGCPIIPFESSGRILLGLFELLSFDEIEEISFLIFSFV